MITVAVGILINNDSVLLCQRKSTACYALKWEFPGGKVEPDEHEEDCLRRELREELGIDATIGELFHRQDAEYADSGRFDVHYYLVDSFSGSLQNLVFERFLWTPVSSLPEFDILEGNRDVVNKLLESYGSNSAGTSSRTA